MPIDVQVISLSMAEADGCRAEGYKLDVLTELAGTIRAFRGFLLMMRKHGRILVSRSFLPIDPLASPYRDARDQGHALTVHLIPGPIDPLGTRELV